MDVFIMFLDILALTLSIAFIVLFFIAMQQRKNKTRILRKVAEDGEKHE